MISRRSVCVHNCEDFIQAVMSWEMLDTRRVPPAPSDPLDPPLQLPSLFTPLGAQEVTLSVRLSSLSVVFQPAHTFFSNFVGPFQHLVLILEHYKQTNQHFKPDEALPSINP